MDKIIELPDILPYPRILDFGKVQQMLMGRLVYIIENYDDTSGLAVVIKISDDHVTVRCGDFDGNPLQPDNNLVEEFGLGYLHTLVSFMKITKVGQGIFYFTNKLELIDFQISLNKFAGPGYIKDILGKVVRTQSIYKVEKLDEGLVTALEDREMDWIVKPSSYKNMNIDNIITPMYGRI